MLAVVGYLVQESLRFPGTIDLDGTTFQSIPNGVAAIGAVPSLGWLQITASIGDNESLYHLHVLVVMKLSVQATGS